MYSDSDLDAAVAAGALSRAGRLREFVARRQTANRCARSTPADHGFNDIFRLDRGVLAAGGARLLAAGISRVQPRRRRGQAAGASPNSSPGSAGWLRQHRAAG